MTISTERQEREDRAARLKLARQKAGLGGPTLLADRFDWNVNNYKAHEAGRNGFGLADAKAYAKAFGVSLQWLNFGIGSQDDEYTEADFQPIEVPLISWVSAGQLSEQSPVIDTTEYPTVPIADISPGRWVALRVDGPSMNKISPPDSIIIVNLDDTRLVANACYVISDETGQATYKRYRPNDNPPFQPASYDDIPPPDLHGAIKVIGRVRRSIIDM